MEDDDPDVLEQHVHARALAHDFIVEGLAGNEHVAVGVLANDVAYFLVGERGPERTGAQHNELVLAASGAHVDLRLIRDAQLRADVVSDGAREVQGGVHAAPHVDAELRVEFGAPHLSPAAVDSGFLTDFIGEVVLDRHSGRDLLVVVLTATADHRATVPTLANNESAVVLDRHCHGGPAKRDIDEPVLGASAVSSVGGGASFEGLRVVGL